jgi:dihydroorotate dehydrogenase electron transfer subunit
VYGGTVEVVFTVRDPATRWLAGLQSQDRVDLVGPIGRPFALPQEPAACAVVADGHGAAPMSLLAQQLRERDCSVHMVLGAVNERGLFTDREARRAAQSVTIATLDGSVGIQGDVTKPLASLLARQQIDVVYACGPAAMLRAVARQAQASGAWCQVAMEATMACAVGICQSCVLPVRGADGVTRPARCCVDGPVFRGDRVEWALL